MNLPARLSADRIHPQCLRMPDIDGEGAGQRGKGCKVRHLGRDVWGKTAHGNGNLPAKRPHRHAVLRREINTHPSRVPTAFIQQAIKLTDEPI